MTRERLIRLTAATIAVPILLASAPAFSQEPRDIRREEPESVPNPLKTFKGIESAWNKEDANRLAGFVGKGRVFLDVRGVSKKGGYYSKSQVKYLFKDMFKADDQLSFEFIKYTDLENPDRKVHGIAYRSCKNNRSGKVFRDKVYVTLGREGPGWVLAEIKTTR